MKQQLTSVSSARTRSARNIKASSSMPTTVNSSGEFERISCASSRMRACISSLDLTCLTVFGMVVSSDHWLRLQASNNRTLQDSNALALITCGEFEGWAQTGGPNISAVRRRNYGRPGATAGWDSMVNHYLFHLFCLCLSDHSSSLA